MDTTDDEYEYDDEHEHEENDVQSRWHQSKFEASATPVGTVSLDDVAIEAESTTRAGAAASRATRCSQLAPAAIEQVKACQTCTLENPASAATCEICGTKFEAVLSAMAQVKTCWICTSDNPASTTECEVCRGRFDGDTDDGGGCGVGGGGGGGGGVGGGSGCSGGGGEDYPAQQTRSKICPNHICNLPNFPSATTCDHCGTLLDSDENTRMVHAWLLHEVPRIMGEQTDVAQDIAREMATCKIADLKHYSEALGGSAESHWLVSEARDRRTQDLARTGGDYSDSDSDDSPDLTCVSASTSESGSDRSNPKWCAEDNFGCRSDDDPNMSKKKDPAQASAVAKAAKLRGNEFVKHRDYSAALEEYMVGLKAGPDASTHTRLRSHACAPALPG
jgi:hypothetical protein